MTDDRDALARTLFEAKGYKHTHWSEVVDTCTGDELRGYADYLLAHGYQLVPDDSVVVTFDDLHLAARSLNFRNRPTYQEMCDLQDRLYVPLIKHGGKKS
jgi:hypothetical protein